MLTQCPVKPRFFHTPDNILITTFSQRPSLLLRLQEEWTAYFIILVPSSRHQISYHLVTKQAVWLSLGRSSVLLIVSTDTLNIKGSSTDVTFLILHLSIAHILMICKTIDCMFLFNLSHESIIIISKCCGLLSYLYAF